MKRTSPQIVSRRAAVPLLGIVFATLMLGGTLPIPLYTLWAPQLGFGALTTTLIFAAYTVGTIMAPLTLAGLSDQAGRRPLLLAAIAGVAVSAGLFLVADSVAVLLVARLLSGAAAGVVSATATAALLELDRGDAGAGAPRTATLANMGGLGLGPVVAGILAASVANPTRTVFWVYLVVLVPVAAVVWLLPETVPNPPSGAAPAPAAAASAHRPCSLRPGGSAHLGGVFDFGLVLFARPGVPRRGATRRQPGDRRPDRRVGVPDRRQYPAGAQPGPRT